MHVGGDWRVRTWWGVQGRAGLAELVPLPAAGHLRAGAGSGRGVDLALQLRLLPQEQRLPGTPAVAMATTEVPTC